MNTRLAVLGVLLSFAAAGCVGVATPARPEMPRTTVSHATDTPAMQQADLLELVRRAANRGGDRGVDRAVALFPDLALLAANGAGADAVLVGASYDRVHGNGADEARRRAVAMLESAPDETTSLAAAGELASRGARHAALVVAGTVDLSAFGWARAVELAGTTADPTAWERLLERRAPGAAWPKASAFANESELWHAIAGWRLGRGEVNQAIFAAVRGEGTAENVALRTRQRLLRAKALTLANRQGEALILLGTTTADVPADRAEALALEALVQAERNELPAAIELFTQALAASPAWSGRERVLGDLAIAMLRSGDESRGVPMLLDAERACEAARDFDGLVRTLRNEAIYRRARGDTVAAAALDTRANELIGSNGLLTDAWSVR